MSNFVNDEKVLGNAEETKVIEETQENVAMQEEKTEEQPIVEQPVEKEKVVEEEMEPNPFDDDEFSMEKNFSEMLDDSFKQLEKGSIIKGVVVAVNNSEVTVDVGYKSEGIIPINEFDPSENVQVNDEIHVFVQNIENKDGQISISKRKAEYIRSWEVIEDKYGKNEPIRGILESRIKGGLKVRLKAFPLVKAFLPGTQLSLRSVPNLDQFLGREYDFMIIKIDKARNNIVISRRKILEKEQEEKKGDLLNMLKKDAVLKGKVKNITDFGVFVDLGGMDGLLHITDMSWGRITHPTELFKIGNEIDVKVLEFEPENEKISLGYKQLFEYPWNDADNKYPIGSTVAGRVVSLTDYGAFIELEKGIEGLIHISEMSWTKRVSHPSEILKVDDKIKAVVLDLNKDEEKISLGLKQLEPNPWITIDKRHPVGSQFKGKVKNITPFGVFVEVEEGIDGLVHISDLSWTKRIYHPSEVVKVGDEIEVLVLEIDRKNHRISLGRKQVTQDPWATLPDECPLNTELEGRITKILDKGVLVEVYRSVEGFVPLSHLSFPELNHPKEVFQNDDMLPLKVIEVDPENRRLILSVKHYFFGREKKDYIDYIESYLERQNRGGTINYDELETPGEMME